MRRSLLIKNCQTFNSKKETKNNKSIGCFFNFKGTFKFLILAVAFSCLSYVFQINKLATMGQEINEREQKLEELKEGNKSLKIKVAQLRSGYYLENERNRLNLVSPDQVSFIEIGKKDSVAMLD
jgi:cell division protein FtsB